jgi:hypothetical protein
MAGKPWNNKLVVVTITVVAVAFLVWIYLRSWEVQHGQAPGITQSNVIKDLPPSQVPPAMPQGIVLAKDAKVLHSYTAVTPQGMAQSTLLYETKESPGLLLQKYTQLFLKNGWWAGGGAPIKIIPQSQLKTSTGTVIKVQVGTSTNQAVQYSLSFTSSSAMMTVGIFANASSSDWLVSLTMINTQTQ